MLPNAALAAFAASPARQRAAHEAGQAVGRRWHRRPDVTRLTQLLDGYAEVPPTSADAFAAAMAPYTSDHGWIDALVTSAVAAMADDPFVALPWRISQGALLSGLALIVRDHAHVALQWVDPVAVRAASSDALTLSFGHSLILVLKSGGVRIATYTLDRSAQPARIVATGTRTLRDGDVIVADNARDMIRLTGLDHDALFLSISHGVADATQPLRSFDRHSGALLRTGTSDSGASRMLPLLQLPRIAARGRGGDVLAAVTHHRDRMVRWEALREWVAIAPLDAYPRLTEVARHDPDPGVRAAAAQTLALVAPALTQLGHLLSDAA